MIDALTDENLFFRSMDSCPIDKKVLLLNKAGIASTGWWDGKDRWLVGWHPLPKIPAEIKAMINHKESNIGMLLGD